MSPALGRAWQRPLPFHAAALLVVLVVALLAIGPHVAFSSDEGVAVIQARMLRDGRGWLYRYPLASMDPQGDARPFEHGDVGSKGVAPYAKHPTYPLLLAGFDLIGGYWAILAVGLAGTVAASVLGALITRRLDPRLDRTVLWLLGLGSPLFFDAFVVLAHTLAAAAVAAGLLLALTVVGRGRTRGRRIVAAAGMGATLMLASLLRTEAVFVGPALAVSMGLAFVLRQVRLRRAVVVAVAAVSASAAAYGVDRLAARAILGRPGSGVPLAAVSSWLDGRWQGLHVTWFQASYLGGATSDAALAVAAALLFGAALLLHGSNDRSRWVVAALVGASACWVVRLVVGPSGAIPGLALAFPAGWFCLWAMGREARRGLDAVTLAVTSVVFVVAVIVTQYAIGGGVEWGGRYFAVILPAAVPLLVYGAAPVIRRHGPALARQVVVGLVVVSALASLTALQGLRAWHHDTAAVLDAIQVAGARAGAAPGLGRPVVVTSNRLVPQIDYRDFERFVWVATDPSNLTRFTDALAARGVDRIVLVSPDQAADLARLPGWKVVADHPGLSDGVAVLEHRPG